VFVEFHNLLGVGHCDYSPRGGKRKKVAMLLIISVQKYWCHLADFEVKCPQHVLS
jgi:hypothetical protein